MNQNVVIGYKAQVSDHANIAIGVDAMACEITSIPDVPALPLDENCRNCGAPVDDGRCEHCGTSYRRCT